MSYQRSSSYSRPSLSTKTSNGTSVSILNDTAVPAQNQTQDPTYTSPSRSHYPSPHNDYRRSSDVVAPPQGFYQNPPSQLTFGSPAMERSTSSNSNDSLHSNGSSMPGLTRADSYEVQGPTWLPPTPPQQQQSENQAQAPPYIASTYEEYGPQSSMVYNYPPPAKYTMQLPSMNPELLNAPYTEGANYDEDQIVNGKGARRYPCRFKEPLGCQKTFTTSGHASRHSKIHTAEKMVNCTFAHCKKRFTRNDNMKQHLDTHTKDKSRSVSKGSGPSTSAGVKKRQRVDQPSRTPSRASIAGTHSQPPTPLMRMVDPALFDQPAPTPSTWGFSQSQAGFSSARMAPSNPLDLLSFAAAQQEQEEQNVRSNQMN